jgi:1,4-alpha-glucan branching enzyme
MTDTLTAPKKSKDSCGIRQFKDGVTFTVIFPDANTVRIAGDFNNWQPEKTPMKKFRKDGLWKVKLPLNAGIYRYRLVVDGLWQQDPYNTATESNPYGELNSVVQVY